MYSIEWDKSSKGFRLLPQASISLRSIRPVFHEELDFFNFDRYWKYPKSEYPLLWAENANRYIIDGELVAELNGGGYFEAPTINVYKEGLILSPVDIPSMVNANESLMKGLEQSALDFIYNKVWKKLHNKVDVVYIAYSGGKDSEVTLNLVYRALGKNDVYVVFSDTEMEVVDTYESFMKAQAQYGDWTFLKAVSHIRPEYSWKLFGPPSRRMRWCCSVHKSVPALLFLKEFLKKDDLKALVFDGVRAEESVSRSDYDHLTIGGKHSSQINASPILRWSSAEVFNYIFQYRLHLNRSYRMGMVRVGCSVCPMASPHFEYICNTKYPDDISLYLNELREYARHLGIPDSRIDDYIQEGGWKARSGGRGINNKDHIDVGFSNRVLTISSMHIDIDMFHKWLPAFSSVVHIGTEKLSVNSLKSGYQYNISISKQDGKHLLSIYPIDNTNRELPVVKYFKNLVSKSIFCIGCRACEAECSVGALKIETNYVKIDTEKCIHCMKCFEFEHGCLRAKSLHVSKGGDIMYKGINRYQHFGFRKTWLSDYLEMGNALFSSSKWGKYQYASMKVWFCEACVTDGEKLLPLGEFMKKNSVDNVHGWAMIWVNLCYNSAIVRWYIENIQTGTAFTKSDLVNELSITNLSEETRKNAVTSLVNTFFESPIGSLLGVGEVEFKGNVVKLIRKSSWQTPTPLVILYALYRFAEAEDGRHSFTLSQLNATEKGPGLSPAAIFGMTQTDLESVLRGLSISHPQYININFSMGLDNINLAPQYTANDILALL